MFYRSRTGRVMEHIGVEHFPDEMNAVLHDALFGHDDRMKMIGSSIVASPLHKNGNGRLDEKPWLLSGHVDGLVILAESSAREFIPNRIIWKDVILVEEEIALNHGWMGLWWVHRGRLQKTHVKFNPSARSFIRSCNRQILATWGVSDASPESRRDPCPCDTRPDRNTYRQLLNYFLTPDEGIESVIYQPALWSCRGWFRKRKHKMIDQQMAARTASRWILMSDDHGIRDLQGGIRVTSLPRSLWSVRALGSHRLIWTPLAETMNERIQMSFPKRARRFVEQGFGNDLTES